MIRILVADDHAIVREGVKRILARASAGIRVVEAKDGVEVMERISQESFDVILLDIAMPAIDGLDVLQRVKGQMPDIPVLVFSMYGESQYALRAFKAGASGYLTKDRAPDELLKAIYRVMSGGRYITESLAELLAESVAGGSLVSPHEKLSSREFQVMRLIASGRTVSEIAGDLGLSVKTISTYRSRVLGKMGMRNNAELVHYAVSRGIVEEAPPSVRQPAGPTGP